MKKLIIVVAIALFTLNISAAEKPVKPNESLRIEIMDLLGSKLPFEFNKNESAIDVLFTVNTKGEIIVISTNIPDKRVEKFIKNKLNYKKVLFNVQKEGEVFLLPLKVKN